MAFLAVYGALLAAGAPGLVLRGLLFNLGPITAMAVAPQALRRARGRQRWGWTAVASLAVCWFIAEAVYSFYELRGAEAPFPSFADLFYYLGYFSLIAAVPLLSPPHRRLSDRRAMLDGATVVVAVGVLAWQFVVEPTGASAGTFFQSALLLGYPLLDLGLIVSLVVLFYGSSGALPPPVAALVVAIAFTVAGDVPYLLGVGAGSTASWPDLLWLAGYFALALALYWAARDPLEAVTRGRTESTLELVLPYVAVTPPGVAMLYEAFTGRVESDLLTGTTIAVMFLMTRQWLTIVENHQLNRAFEAEIETREQLLIELERRNVALEELRREAQFRADHDSLTGLLNRRAWFSLAADADATSVAIFDIDFFKRINDTYGHPVGDHVLKEVAWRLGGLLGPGSALGRLGGEEFAAFFTSDAEDPVAQCHAAVETIATVPVVLPWGEELAISVSAGLAPAGDGADRDQVLAAAYELADGALYEAKQGGRRRLVYRFGVEKAA
ncbi:MAG: GGDEF domain-containing protein [Dehalococcoidia bacterium]